jgi:class I fructose-bisphosphate aldolase
MARLETRRPALAELDLSPGKRTRLHRLLYKYGPANGTMLVLPIDQGLEHGPRDFFENPEAKDPEYELRLARDGNFSAIAFQIGIAAKHIGAYAGEVPLILKLTGKTEIPPSDRALSPLLASVEDAVRLGADAVGYTLYVGSPRQDEDFVAFGKVRAEADRLGMPVIVWAYPRGEDVERKGGRDSLYAIDYAARVAAEVGADVVKLNMPKRDAEKDRLAPAPYNELDLPEGEAMRMVVESAGRAPVLLSGGSRVSDDDLLQKAEIALEAGATGMIFGRNVWQRPYEDALAITARIHELMAQYGD